MNEPTYTAPRVTPADIEAQIVSEHYFTAADGVFGVTGREVDKNTGGPLHLLTLAVLLLRNGFVVTGESACASPENFNAEKGREIARAAAVSKCWALLGYELRTRLSSGHAVGFDLTSILTPPSDQKWGDLKPTPALPDCASVTPPAVPVASADRQQEAPQDFEILGEEVLSDQNTFGYLFRMAVQRGGKRRDAMCAFSEVNSFGPQTKEEARAKVIAELRKAYADDDRQQDT